MNLKQYAEQNNLKISQISRGAGIPYTTVSELVNGKKDIGKCNAETVYALARYLGTSMEYLMVFDSGGRHPDKFSLSREQSIFLAKKKWDENVYCGMRMEARAITFTQTKTILEGINVPAVSLDDIIAVRNMKDAWKFIIENMSLELSLDYICRLNSFIARDESLEWGVLRTGNVGISGSSYKPPVPEKYRTESEIGRILSSFVSATERALELFCYITHSQLFWDGNKRTALAASNKILLDNNCGMMTIGDNDMEEFNVMLSTMYSTGEKEILKDFLYSKAIIGID